MPNSIFIRKPKNIKIRFDFSSTVLSSKYSILLYNIIKIEIEKIKIVIDFFKPFLLYFKFIFYYHSLVNCILSWLHITQDDLGLFNIRLYG